MEPWNCNKINKSHCKLFKKELIINKILSSIISLNKASEKVLLKNRFKKYGEIKKFYKFGSKKFSKIFFIRYL